MIGSEPLIDPVTAISVGMVDGKMLLDLDYSEDSSADVDMNIVMTGEGKLIEAQATAEGLPFTLQEMNSMVKLAEKGIDELKIIQMKSFQHIGPDSKIFA